jgi:hypothetical protein
VKRFLQDCRQKTNGAAKKYLPAMFEEQLAAVSAGKLYAPDNPVIPGNSTQMGTSKGDTEPDMAAKVLISNQEDCNPTSMKAAALLLAEPRSVQPSNYRVSSSEFQCPTSKKLEAASGSKDNKVGEQLHHSTATNTRGYFVDDNYNTSHHSVPINNRCPYDDISIGDEDMLEKSMKRTAWKNLDGQLHSGHRPPHVLLMPYLQIGVLPGYIAWAF